MSVASRLRYWRRIIEAYSPGTRSQLTFWHDTPTVEDNNIEPGQIGRYYMRFDRKADYAGLTDERGVPKLDYRGAIGVQYNPISIAQYCLGNHTAWTDAGDQKHKSNCITAGDWLVENLEPNKQDIPVWHHKFDWDYAEILSNPWYSGLAQGQGISALLRCYAMTDSTKYLDAATSAFRSLTLEIPEGGVLLTDTSDLWIEEYLVSDPTHILNGFMWAMWGVYDYYLATGDSRANEIWNKCVGTLKHQVESFDTGYWSLYDHSADGRLKMIASSFYHRLHIVQLAITSRLADEPYFLDVSHRWDGYANKSLNRWRAKINKTIFKILKY